jgi:hypothetical protein
MRRMQGRREMNTKEDDHGARYIPTEDEIRRICEEEIQPTWSSKEKRRKGCGEGRVPWRLPVVGVDALPDDVQRMIESINKGNENGDHKTEAVVRR